MAFAGMMIAGIFIAILIGMLFTSGVFLILGIVLRVRKRKRTSGVMFVISALLAAVAIGLPLYMISRPKEVDTPGGTVKIRRGLIKKYESSLEAHDLEAIKKLIKKHPEMLSYSDINEVSLIDYALFNCDIEMMQMALDAGAVFDDPVFYDHLIFYSSLDAFFERLDYPEWTRDESARTKPGETTQRMIDAVSFAIDHGAALEWETNGDYEQSDFYTKARNWVRQDNDISETDSRFLAMIKEKLPEAD